MSGVERAIILAAGRGNQVDGMAKVLVRHPVTGKTVLEHAVEAFAGKQITVVVGFRAIQVMEAAPQLDYVINADWALTNNAMSLGLALTDAPTYVVSGDIFFDRALIEHLDAQGPDLALTQARENRTLSAVHCVLHQEGAISETYQGPIRDVTHPEALGLFKISHPDVLARWKRQSIQHGNLFVGQTLPCGIAPVQSVPLRGFEFTEINTPADYLRLLERSRRA